MKMKSLSRCCVCCIELHQGKDKPPLINRLKLNLIKHITVYKITKIVCVLWLAKRRVCMRVCKHGCDVKMFCFSRANHASTNLKKVLSWKPRQVYFIHPFPRRLKLGKSLETCCVNFFSLELSWAMQTRKMFSIA